MHANKLSGWLLAGLLVSTSACAAPPITGRVTLQEVATLGLMPTQPTPDKTGRWASFPYLKLYAEGQLLFSGGPADFTAEALKKRPSINADIKVRALAQELAVLKLKRGSTGSNVIVAYVSDPCPPCDRLIETALSSLKPAGFGAIEQIRVVVH